MRDRGSESSTFEVNDPIPAVWILLLRWSFAIEKRNQPFGNGDSSCGLCFECGFCFLEFSEQALLLIEFLLQAGDSFLLFADLFEDDFNRCPFDP